jgi:ribonuclease VapC
MIVDTSALVAVVVREPGYEAVLAKLSGPTTVAGIGTPTIAELGIVLSARLRIDARSHVAELLDRLDIAEVPFGEAHWREAVDAYWRFGRGRHPASLNFGDCLTYAVARLANEPLLFVGDDFAATDLIAA